MAKRELKVHLLRPRKKYEPKHNQALCGKITENSTTDAESVSCKSCSGIYRTNMEWYSQVRNKAVESRRQSGEGDLYTRSDLEAGLARIGWTNAAIRQVLNETQVFRDVVLAGDSLDPWEMAKMGVRGNS